MKKLFLALIGLLLLQAINLQSSPPPPRIQSDLTSEEIAKLTKYLSQAEVTALAAAPEIMHLKNQQSKLELVQLQQEVKQKEMLLKSEQAKTSINLEMIRELTAQISALRSQIHELKLSIKISDLQLSRTDSLTLSSRYHPLQLNDEITPDNSITHRGVIMTEFLRLINKDKILQSKDIRTDLALHYQLLPPPDLTHLPPYQDILHDLKNKKFTDEKLADALLQGFEIAIMNLYDERSYYIGGYSPWRSALITGLPKFLSPSYWKTETAQALEQLINELDLISKILFEYNVEHAMRLHMIVNQYKHWKRNLLGAALLTSLGYTTGTGKKLKNLASDAANIAIEAGKKAWSYIPGKTPIDPALEIQNAEFADLLIPKPSSTKKTLKSKST